MANKTLKSLNFGGADNYFPLPLVTAADNDKILSVVNGEWAAIDAPASGGGSGSYVWTKQGMSENVTEDTTGGTYTLTTADNSRPSSEIEYASAAPTYDSAKRQWIFTNPTVVTIVNSNDTLPVISGNVYCRVTSEPNVWYLVTSFNKGSSSPYLKDMAYSKKITANVDWAKRYLTDKVEDAYPLDGWLDRYYYKQVVNDPIVGGGGATWIQSNKTNGKFHRVYGSNGIWVAGGDSDGLYYSTDGGATWTQSNKTSGEFHSIYYSNGIWVAGGFNMGLYYSTDGGATWTQSNITSGQFDSVYYSNGIWVAGSAGGDSNGLYFSTDGKTWNQSNKTSETFRSVYYSNGIWVAGSGTSKKGLYYSTNGKTWTQSNITSEAFYSVYYSNGIWVAGSGSSKGLYYSTDGKTWTQSNITNMGIWSVYGSDGIWVAATSGNGLHYSTDGKTWTKSTLPNAPYGTFYSVHYSNGIWVAGSGSGYGLYYSTDGGSTWIQSNITSGNVNSVCYSNGVWVAGSFSSYGLYYSETIPVEVDF